MQSELQQLRYKRQRQFFLNFVSQQNEHAVLTPEGLQPQTHRMLGRNESSKANNSAQTDGNVCGVTTSVKAVSDAGAAAEVFMSPVLLGLESQDGKYRLEVNEQSGEVKITLVSPSKEKATAKKRGTSTKKPVNVPAYCIPPSHSISSLSWDKKSTRVVALIEGGEKQLLVMFKIGTADPSSGVVDYSASTIFTSSASQKVTSNVDFDEDGLFYFGDDKGMLHVTDQITDPAAGAQSLTIQGCLKGALNMVKAYTKTDIMGKEEKRLLIAQTSSPQNFEVRILSRQEGEFEIITTMVNSLRNETEIQLVHLNENSEAVAHLKVTGCKGSRYYALSTVEYADLKDLTEKDSKEAAPAGGFFSSFGGASLLSGGGSIEGKSLASGISLEQSGPLSSSPEVLGFSYVPESNSVIFLSKTGAIHHVTLGDAPSKEKIHPVPISGFTTTSTNCLMEYSSFTKSVFVAHTRGDRDVVSIIALKSGNVPQIDLDPADILGHLYDFSYTTTRINQISLNSDSSFLCLQVSINTRDAFGPTVHEMLVFYRISFSGEQIIPIQFLKYSPYNPKEFKPSPQPKAADDSDDEMDEEPEHQEADSAQEGADAREANPVTAIDWSKQSSFLRLSLADFSKLYIMQVVPISKGDSLVADARPTNVLEATGPYFEICDFEEVEDALATDLASRQTKKKHQDSHSIASVNQEFWKTEHCLTRWDTLGAFSPDATEVGGLLIIDQKGTSSCKKNDQKLLVAMHRKLLKIYHWPCIVPKLPFQPVMMPPCSQLVSFEFVKFTKTSEDQSLIVQVKAKPDIKGGQFFKFKGSGGETRSFLLDLIIN